MGSTANHLDAETLRGLLDPQDIRVGGRIRTLLAATLPATRWVVDGLLPAGLSLLAGNPKVGKSWLALALALDVAAGAPTLGGLPTARCGVLYLALEDSPQRVQARLRSLLGTAEPPAAFHFRTSACKWPRLDKGGQDALEMFLDQNPSVGLVVIDTLQKVKPIRQGRRNPYETDYDDVAGLQTLATSRNVAILVLTHRSKRETEDVFASMSGTNGVTAPADTMLVLDKQRSDAIKGTLHVTGRDVDDQTLEVRHERGSGRWLLDRDAVRAVQQPDAAHRSADEQRVLDRLAHAPDGLTLAELEAALPDKSADAVKALLKRMVSAGLIVRAGRGRYRLPPIALLAPAA